MDEKQAPPPEYSAQAPPPPPTSQQQNPPAGYYPPPAQHGGYPPPQPGGYPTQPQQGYPTQPQQYGGYQAVPQMQQPQVQVVTVTTSPPAYREVPINVACQNCNQVVCTRVEYENGLLVWLLVGAICFFGIPFFLFLGCCFIPMCIPSLKDVGHYCPICNRKLGTYQRVR